MNNERTIVLENVSSSTIGLKDTQGRMYRIGRMGKIRISAVILQDIFDHPGSKIIFKEGMAKVSNVTRNELLAMGLTEGEVNLFIKDELIEEPKEEEKVEEVVEEPVEEEVIEEEPVAEIIEEPVVEEPVVEEPVVEEPKEEKTIKATKKSAKKPTKKSSSKRK